MPKSRQVNAGTVVSMECKAPRGVPEPIVWWEKDGVQLNAGYESHQKTFYVFKKNVVSSEPLIDSYHFFDNGSLVIKNASVTDNGEYVCVAKNDAGFRKTAPARLNVFGIDFSLVKLSILNMPTFFGLF
jgi:hypothetical protein